MTTNRKIMTKIGWNFDNSYARLPDTFYTIINATLVHSPELVILNHALAASLGLNESELQSEEGIEILSVTEFQKTHCLLLKHTQGINSVILQC